MNILTPFLAVALVQGQPAQEELSQQTEESFQLMDQEELKNFDLSDIRKPETPGTHTVEATPSDNEQERSPYRLSEQEYETERDRFRVCQALGESGAKTTFNGHRLKISMPINPHNYDRVPGCN